MEASWHQSSFCFLLPASCGMHLRCARTFFFLSIWRINTLISVKATKIKLQINFFLQFNVNKTEFFRIPVYLKENKCINGWSASCKFWIHSYTDSLFRCYILYFKDHATEIRVQRTTARNAFSILTQPSLQKSKFCIFQAAGFLRQLLLTGKMASGECKTLKSFWPLLLQVCTIFINVVLNEFYTR